MAYYSLEPFGDDLFDRQMAQLEALLANVNRDPKKRSRPYRPEDFVLRQEPGSRIPKQELTPSQIYQSFKKRLGL